MCFKCLSVSGGRYNGGGGESYCYRESLALDILSYDYAVFQFQLYINLKSTPRF